MSSLDMSKVCMGLLLVLRFSALLPLKSRKYWIYLLGFNHIRIPVAYTMGYLLATFTTFVRD